MLARRALLGGALGLAACGSTSPAPRSHPPPVPPIRLSSPAFPAGATIPRRYTCDGADLSVPLRWSGVPTGTSSLSLTMRDPDAPGGSFIHWRLTGIPASISAIETGQLPSGVSEGVNGFGTRGYRGPCPPPGDPAHHYVITLTALRGQRPVAVGKLRGLYRRR
jgi:Raf kinase inhibitor-like YbhB/YbcL family protein